LIFFFFFKKKKKKKGGKFGVIWCSWIWKKNGYLKFHLGFCLMVSLGVLVEDDKKLRVCNVLDFGLDLYSSCASLTFILMD
jgi:hypothetical protein